MLVLLLAFLPASVSPILSAICFGELLLDLPVRYLHIQLIEEGRNLTESRGPIDFFLDIEKWLYTADVVDRGDGMYVFRLALARPVEQVTIRLILGNTELCHSPILLVGHEGRQLSPEYCNCPVALDKWLQLVDCPAEPQIEKDLAPFPSIDFAAILKKAEATWGRPEYARTYAFCHYQIIENRAYRKCYGEYTGFSQFLDKTLASLFRKVSLPNTEFLFNLGDYPLSYVEDVGPSFCPALQNIQKVPMVSWCGSENTLDLVLPTYIYSEQIIDYKFYDANIHYSGSRVPWAEKTSKAIFRGRDSSQLRLDLARLSQEERNGLIDAGITAYFFFDEAKNAPKRERISFEDFFSYKYILSVDGTVAAYRFPNLLAGSSLLLKADSHYYEHFYSKMEPYVHYIPFNGQNVKEVLKWVTETDLNETLRNQRQFVLDHLQPKNMYCYLVQFFQKYTERLVKRPTEVIKGADPGEGRYVKCDCWNKERKKEEL